ncbi:ABC transporter ATP-binding protein [Rhodococcus opacus]|uniref:ABC transporter ATP-binding protein n=1 Tax=Rhodococcus opacus TaxID=37919 RepID=UPI001C2072E9|nr:ABC transporter ATP-binding protein [Rhodococcus opacus]
MIDTKTMAAPEGQQPSELADEHAPVLRVQHLVKHFHRAGGAEVRAIDGVTLDIVPGEILVLLGPSGCGKTTLLRSVAGLESPDSGRIEIQGRPVYASAQGTTVPPERRRLSMIFQSYALWPHMSVFDNVAYPVKHAVRPRVGRRELTTRVQSVMDMVGIGELGRQFPSQLSGGQQQRVALARAMVAESQLVLFDEPMSNVDAKVREQLRVELLSMQQRLNFSALYVTHDQGEAMGLGDRIAVMRDGRVAQLGSPQDIYERPTSRYVAHFVGSSNELTGTLVHRDPDGSARVRTSLGVMTGTCIDPEVAVGDSVVLLWRPEQTILSDSALPHSINEWEGQVETALFLGPHVEHILCAGDATIRTRGNQRLIACGTRVHFSVRPEHARVLPAADRT